MELREYLQIIRKRIWLVVIITLISTIASAVVSFFVLEPVYQSNTSLYVGKKIDGQSAIAYQDLLLGNQLVKDYRELVKSRLVANLVISELKLENMTTGRMSQKLGVNLKNDTRLIEITAEDTKAELAAQIANKVAEVFQVKVVEIMDVENVQVIDKAEIPLNPIKPKKYLNVAIAAFIGLMLGFGIIFLIEYLDNTLKTPTDVERHLELPVIGTIPVFPE
ncbi:Wzz/FepE/Etk N-terminal domain-containing protein [Petroclostridium sp. X23]|uniref:YveK family protein n=1 Tax=Petroclostridium sp. X23 TaxID=3045146 RepID=UPI0024ACF1DC|nr:Wzz/FepE/Etk N-terminal domain-containing protein [Petroclostridium sp. X23]WHH57518.1 Wzz/FepE/Etk N-terminal domain-containing protein [Petroclostridium sp. X23]